jgi:hypothetical protein
MMVMMMIIMMMMMMMMIIKTMNLQCNFINEYTPSTE